MNIPDQELEQILRHAPSPKPPAGLKDLLVSQSPSSRLAAAEPAYQTASGWLRRWSPVLAPGLGGIACAVVLTVQQMELRDLRRSIEVPARGSGQAQSTPAIAPASPNDSQQTDSTNREKSEIERLQKLASEIRAEVSQLEQLRVENERLRQRLAMPEITGLSGKQAEDLEKARERGLSIQCINNLKQFGLSVRTWAQDENLAQPPNVLCMSNELASPKILVCPADSSRQAASGWSVFTPANCSYEYLVTSGTNTAETEPNLVMSRCPIHGHVGLADGSVQSQIAKIHPDWLVNRNGKLYFERRADILNSPPK